MFFLTKADMVERGIFLFFSGKVHIFLEGYKVFKESPTLDLTGYSLNHLLLRLISTLLKLEISKQTNAKADDSNL